MVFYKKYFSEKQKTFFNCRNLIFKMGVKHKKKEVNFFEANLFTRVYNLFKE